MSSPEQQAYGLAWFWGPDDDIEALFDALVVLESGRTGSNATQAVFDDVSRLIDSTMTSLPPTGLNRWRALQWWDLQESVASWRLMLVVHWARLQPDMRQLVGWRIEKHRGQPWMQALLRERRTLFGM